MMPTMGDGTPMTATPPLIGNAESTEGGDV
jgi:hypothetical protein